MTKPQLNVTLQEGEVGVIEYPLNTPAFANIHSLSVFFVSAISQVCSITALEVCARAKLLEVK